MDDVVRMIGADERASYLGEGQRGVGVGTSPTR